jgi:hypothetical protein
LAQQICANIKSRPKGKALAHLARQYAFPIGATLAHWRTSRPRKRKLELRGFAARQAVKRIPPNLQALVAAHGGYDKITRETWAEYDTQLSAWQAYIRRGGDWVQAGKAPHRYAIRKARVGGR